MQHYEDPEAPQSREEFEDHIGLIVSRLRNCGFVCKNFLDLLQTSDDDGLTHRVINSLKPGVLDLLSLPVNSLTPDDFAQFPRVEMVLPIPGVHQPVEGGVYLLLVESTEGVEWALYVGCSGACGFRSVRSILTRQLALIPRRLVHHHYDVIKAEANESTQLHAVCKRLKAQPQMIQIAADEPEPQPGFREFAESVLTVKLNTLHEAADKRHGRHLTFVKDMQPESASQPTFIGCNRALSINQAVSSDTQAVESDIECRKCNA